MFLEVHRALLLRCGGEKAMLVTVTGHGSEVSHSVFFRDVANEGGVKMSLLMDEHSIGCFDLIGRKELILMVDSDEMTSGETQPMTGVGLNRVEQG